MQAFKIALDYFTQLKPFLVFRLCLDFLAFSCCGSSLANLPLNFAAHPMAQIAQNVTQRISENTRTHAKQLRTRRINSAFAVSLKFRRRVSVFNFIIYAETPVCVCVPVCLSAY